MTVARLWASTGSPAADALLPAALRLVGAVREGDAVEVQDALDDAQAAAARPDWARILLLTVAAMVPDGDQPSVLLAWCQQDRDPRVYHPGAVSGEEHPRAKLTTCDVAEIRRTFRRHTVGEADRFATRYGVTRGNIYRIVRGETRRAG